MATNMIISYKSDLNSFFNEMNIQPDDYVTAADIRKWINDVESNGCKAFGYYYDQSTA